MPWNNFSFLPNLYVILDEQTSLEKNRYFENYINLRHSVLTATKNIFRSLMNIKGLQINEKYAETFQIIKMENIIAIKTSWIIFNPEFIENYCCRILNRRQILIGREISLKQMQIIFHSYLKNMNPL